MKNLVTLLSPEQVPYQGFASASDAAALPDGVFQMARNVRTDGKTLGARTGYKRVLGPLPDGVTVLGANVMGEFDGANKPRVLVVGTQGGNLSLWCSELDSGVWSPWHPAQAVGGGTPLSGSVQPFDGLWQIRSRGWPSQYSDDCDVKVFGPDHAWHGWQRGYGGPPSPSGPQFIGGVYDEHVQPPPDATPRLRMRDALAMGTPELLSSRTVNGHFHPSAATTGGAALFTQVTGSVGNEVRFWNATSMGENEYMAAPAQFWLVVPDRMQSSGGTRLQDNVGDFLAGLEFFLLDHNQAPTTIYTPFVRGSMSIIRLEGHLPGESGYRFLLVAYSLPEMVGNYRCSGFGFRIVATTPPRTDRGTYIHVAGIGGNVSPQAMFALTTSTAADGESPARVLSHGRIGYGVSAWSANSRLALTHDLTGGTLMLENRSASKLVALCGVGTYSTLASSLVHVAPPWDIRLRMNVKFPDEVANANLYRSDPGDDTGYFARTPAWTSISPQHKQYNRRVPSAWTRPPSGATCSTWFAGRLALAVEDLQGRSTLLVGEMGRWPRFAESDPDSPLEWTAYGHRFESAVLDLFTLSASPMGSQTLFVVTRDGLWTVSNGRVSKVGDMPGLGYGCAAEGEATALYLGRRGAVWQVGGGETRDIGTLQVSNLTMNALRLSCAHAEGRAYFCFTQSDGVRRILVRNLTLGIWESLDHVKGVNPLVLFGRMPGSGEFGFLAQDGSLWEAGHMSDNGEPIPVTLVSKAYSSGPRGGLAIGQVSLAADGNTRPMKGFRRYSFPHTQTDVTIPLPGGWTASDGSVPGGGRGHLACLELHVQAIAPWTLRRLDMELYGDYSHGASA